MWGISTNLENSGGFTLILPEWRIDMVTKGMDSVYISVHDMESALAFYQDTVGMTLLADETLKPDQIQQLWNLPPGTEARAAFLKSEQCSTLLQVIEFMPPSGQVINPGAEAIYYGLSDIAFSVNDIDTIYRDLVAKGWQFVSPPILHQPESTPHPLKLVLFLGPGNAPHNILERMTSPEPVSPPAFIRMISSTQIVTDMDEVIRFYVDILGLDLTMQISIPQGLMEKLRGFPGPTSLKVAFVTRKDSNAAPVELIQPAVGGRFGTVAARPPNVGLFMISFEVDDLTSVIARLSQARIPVLSGPVELHTRLHGKMTAITIEDPNSSLVGLFER